MNGEGGAEPSNDHESAVALQGAVSPLLRMTRILVGVAMQAVDQSDTGVSLPQFRLLMTLAERGPTPSAQVADRLGAVASSVTRLADHLEEAGYLHRRRERPNRSIVRLELTESGQALVDRVIHWRAAELDRLLAELPPRDRTQLARLVARFCDAADPDYSSGRGPLPL